MEVFDRLMEVNSLLITLGFGGIFACINKIYKAVKGNKEQIERRFANLEYANLAILHDKIYKQCSDYLIEGWVSIDDLENLEYLWKGYRELGGNGTGETLYKKVLELPNQPLKEKNK